MTPTQRRCLEILRDEPLAISADQINSKLRPRIGRLAVTSAMRSAEKKGWVNRLAPRDQWSTAKWAIQQDGREALEAT